MTHFLTAGPPQAKTHLLLAHGAGAPMTSPFMDTMTRLLTDRGLQISRFEFEYMAARRTDGKRRPPPRAELLMPEYERAVEELRRRTSGQELLVGGKSLGGRVASLVADDLLASGAISALVCLGYPFHPPGKPDNLRTAHLAALRCPTLIVQGERDPFGSRGEVGSYRLSPAIKIVWAADGDHDLGPRGGSGFRRAGNLALAADAVCAFARGVG